MANRNLYGASPHIISQGKYTEELFVRAKLWRSDYDQVHESCVDRRQFLNLVTWDVSSLISQLSPTKGVKETQGDCSVCQFFHHPIPCHHANKKKALKLPFHRYLPTPNISFSPSFLHFRPYFSLLPIVYLPPLKRKGVGWKVQDWGLFPGLCLV